MPRVTPLARRASRPRDARWPLSLAAAAALLSCTLGLARAEDRPGHERLNLPPDSQRVDAALAIGLDVRSLGAPVALAPDVYAGVTERLTLGLIHSGRALGLLDSAWGLCLTGRAGGCNRDYSGLGLDGWFTFLGHRRFELATRFRVYVARFTEPYKLRYTVGLVGVLRAGPVALRFDPHLSIGLSNRELGNADALDVPIHLYVSLGRHVALYLRTGLRGLLRDFDEQYAIPVGLGVLVRPAARWRVGAQFVLRQLLGPLNTEKKRDLLLYADYRFGLPL